MYRYILPAVALFLTGCSSDGPLPMATTAEKSKPVLVAALDAWKAGKSADDLKAQSPVVHFLDADLRAGAKLANYKIEDDGRPNGTGFRYDVTLTIERGGKPASPKKIAYRVVTEPQIAIAREDD